ncbi:hypothetical protein DPMN_044254 [Dreissena polymorpha]|uniref:Uncharacterized protein n=1 Tax=Dreissena polymorpha TaxID=45954 RepID=A0A9D4D497_DREPO|nr:hypothetical protein DPMN_044254 [Dreissena polymorpha]
MSRIVPPLSPCPSYVTGIKPRDVPCGRCQYCTKVDQQWGSFTEEVENAIGLSTGSCLSFSQVLAIQKNCPVDPHDKPSAASGPKQGPQHGGRVWDPGGQVWSGQISLKLACTQRFCKHPAIVIPVLK